MPKDATLSHYQRRLDNAPEPSETSAAAEYRNCLNYIDSILQENDGSDYNDADSRDNFGWNVTELHGHRLLFEIPHSELPTFTLRWPDADSTLVIVRDPLPDEYYDNHSRTNLNYYTTFVMDFEPYSETGDTAENSDTTDDNRWNGPYSIGA